MMYDLVDANLVLQQLRTNQIWNDYLVMVIIG